MICHLSLKKDEDKESMGKTSSLDFAFIDELELTDTVADTTKPVHEGASKLEPPSAFMEAFRVRRRAALLAMSQQLRVQER